MSDAPRLTRRAALAAGLGIAGLSLANMIQLNRSQSTSGSERSGPRPESTGQPMEAGAELRPLRLGWSPWADAEVISLMAKQLIETHLHWPVERVLADIGIQYASVARGDLDVMLMAWLPLTHRDYWTRVRDRVLDLGPMYSGRLGWVVPDYVDPQVLSSIDDLRQPLVAARFNNQVQGIDPGSGLNQLSQVALKDYNLPDMRLVASSSAAMTAVLDQAIREQRWLIVTSWTPHWMFARYKLRFLEDPKRAFGGTEWIQAIARQDLSAIAPAVTDFLTRFRIPDAELAQVLLQAHQGTAQAAVDAYLQRHPERVRYWVSGAIGPASTAG